MSRGIGRGGERFHEPIACSSILSKCISTVGQVRECFMLFKRMNCWLRRNSDCNRHLYKSSWRFWFQSGSSETKVLCTMKSGLVATCKPEFRRLLERYAGGKRTSSGRHEGDTCTVNKCWKLAVVIVITDACNINGASIRRPASCCG
jgi:hypothetical protein